MIESTADKASTPGDGSAGKSLLWTYLIGSTFLIPGLAISGWSMYSYMREQTNAPIALCLGASAAFDGIGLFAANKAHAFASKGRKAKFAWVIVWCAVAASVVINWRHASAQHWNGGIHILISAPAAAAAAAFEIMMQETREEERSRHEKRTRTRQSVKIDVDIWLHHPLMVWGERRRESADRLREALRPHGESAGSVGHVPGPRASQDGQGTKNTPPDDTWSGRDMAITDAPDTGQATAGTQDIVAETGQDTAEGDGTPVPAETGHQGTDITDDQGNPSGTYLDMSRDIAAIEQALDAAQPPDWSSLKKAEAVRRFDSVLPGYSPRDVAGILSARGVQVDPDYVRKARTRARESAEGAGTVVNLANRRGA